MACRPPVFLRTFDLSLHGVRTVLCGGDGYTVALEWHKEYLKPSNWDLVYNLYWSTNQATIHSEGPKFTMRPNTNDSYLSIDLLGGFDVGKVYYFLVKGSGHEPGTLLFDQLPDGSQSGLKMYPETMLIRDISSTDMVIPVDDVSEFPAMGIILIGSELIKYSNIDTVNNYFIISERGAYGYPSRIHTTDGYDGYRTYIVDDFGNYLVNDGYELVDIWPGISSKDPFIHLWKGWEDENSAVGMTTIRFDDQYARIVKDGYGFRERSDIVSGTGNLDVVDAANVGFLAYDLSGWRRTFIPDYIAGKCIGTYFGGEYGCADGIECDGAVRGLSVQDIINMREEYLLQIDGEPVVLFRRMWTGKQSQHTSYTRENTTYRGLDTYGTSLVTGYEQYFNPRQSDGKILVRFGPTKEDFKRDDAGIENSYIPNCWTLVIPTIKDGDFIIRFNQDGTEEWRYEVIDVERNRTLLQESGAQKFTAVRVRKTDPICQVRAIRDTSTLPREILTSIGMVLGPGGIPAHMHRIVIAADKITSVSQINQLTSVDQGHNHPVTNGVVQNILFHTHSIIFP